MSIDGKPSMEKAEVEECENVSGTVTQTEEDLDSIEETSPGWFLFVVSFVVGLGGVLFGYDTGVISGVLVVIGDDLGHTLDSGEKQLVTSIMSAGAFFGGIFGGTAIERYGRKKTMFASSLLFVVGTVIQASSFTIAQMAVGRAVVGLGVGVAALVAPLYISELSPAKYRGRMITLDSLCITGSQVLSYIVDFGFQNVKGGWRFMVGGAGIPAIILGVAILFIPESPRYLIEKEKFDEATVVIRKIYPNATETQVQNKVKLIQSFYQYEQQLVGELSLKDRFRSLYCDMANFKALVVACGLMGLQQLSGSNTMTFYAPTLFSLVGFDQPIAVSIITSAANFVFTIVSMLVIDRAGRRRLLISSMWVMSVFLILAAVAIKFVPINPDLSLDGKAELTWAGILLLVSIILYIAAYAVGIGNVAWFANELFPMEVRSLGTSMVTCTCWALNVVVSATFLSMMQTFTPSGAFGFYVGTTFVGWICVILFYPEVTDLSLEEIKEIFQHGWGVRYSSKLRRERRMQRLGEAV